MPIRIVRLGTPRARDEGTRIGTVRRPPRGVPKEQFAAQDWYDVWYSIQGPNEHGVSNWWTKRTQVPRSEWLKLL